MRLWLVIVCGCGVSVTGSQNSGIGGNDQPDASTQPSPQQDAGDPVVSDAPSGPTCSNGRVVFLNFGPQAVTRAATSNALDNQIDWLTKPSSTVPAFHGGSASDAQQVTTLVTQALSSFPITVVTTRPTSGEYVMILFGGTESSVGTSYGHAQNTLDCGDTNKNDVGWVSDTVPTLQEVANDAVGAIGYGIGLTATTDTGDCMCGWGNNCVATGNACTLSTQIAAQNDCGKTSQDEVAAFEAAFCQ